MRLTTVFIIAAILQVSASGFAQRLTFKAKEASLQELFKAIRTQTGYNVVVSAEKLDAAKPITVNFKNEPLENVLKISLEGQNLSYTMDKNTIAIKEKEASFLDKARAVIQGVAKDLWQDVVRGVVKDQEGKPLPNASIRIKGKNAVTNTNQNGEFEIKGVDENAVLLVSYVGFKTLEISLKDAVLPLEIKLNVATGELEEVNVTYSTGYQNIPKERATGSFVQIDNETINRGISTNILDRIAYLTSSLRKGNNPVGTAGVYFGESSPFIPCQTGPLIFCRVR